MCGITTKQNINFVIAVGASKILKLSIHLPSQRYRKMFDIEGGGGETFKGMCFLYIFQGVHATNDLFRL